MTLVKDLTTEQILKTYTLLPKRFHVKFALRCCNEIKHLIKDDASIKALDLTQRWYDGDKSITEEMLRDASNAAAYASASASAASASAYAASASASAYASASYAYAAYAASASYALLAMPKHPTIKSKDWTKEILLSMIDEDLSLIEKAMILDVR